MFHKKNHDVSEDFGRNSMTNLNKTKKKKIYTKIPVISEKFVLNKINQLF